MRPPRTYSDRAVRQRRALGVDGEQLAADAYEAAGYRILDRNWRCREGELDLVVARDEVIVFGEVKTRTSTAYGSPAAAVTVTKQRRIRRLAMRWLDEHDVHRRSLRFDVVAVIDGTVEIIPGAF